MATTTPLLPIRAATRRRRGVVTEDRCVYCGAWTVRQGSRPRLTCGSSCRTLLHRLRRRGERAPFGKEV